MFKARSLSSSQVLHTEGAAQSGAQASFPRSRVSQGRAGSALARAGVWAKPPIDGQLRSQEGLLTRHLLTGNLELISCEYGEG